jgi:hypothetical protein
MARYADRGWPTFERAEGEMAKRSAHVIDLGTLRTLAIPRGGGKFNSSNIPYPRHAHPATLLPGPASKKSADELASQASYRNPNVQGVVGALTGGRGAPMPADAFFAELSKKKFTNGSDVEPVSRLYESTLKHALGCATKLELRRGEGSPFVGHDFVNIGRSLSLCQRLEDLVLASCGLRDDSAETLFGHLGKGHLPRLQSISVGGAWGDRGMYAILGAVQRGAMPRLTKLDINRNAYKDGGMLQLVAALERGALPEITLIYAQCGSYADASLRALAAMVAKPHVAPKLTTLFLHAPKDKGIQKLFDEALKQRPRLKRTTNNLHGLKVG